MGAAVLRAARASHGAGDEDLSVHGKRHPASSFFVARHDSALARALRDPFAKRDGAKAKRTLWP
jgi:hypothetical protein